jgi:hypothetical protein
METLRRLFLFVPHKAQSLTTSVGPWLGHPTDFMMYRRACANFRGAYLLCTFFDTEFSYAIRRDFRAFSVIAPRRQRQCCSIVQISTACENSTSQSQDNNEDTTNRQHACMKPSTVHSHCLSFHVVLRYQIFKSGTVENDGNGAKLSCYVLVVRKTPPARFQPLSAVRGLQE